FTQSGGTNNCIGLYLGYSASASGAYNLSGSGVLTAASTEYIGYSGTGTFTQSGGTNNLSGKVNINGNASILFVGYNNGSSGVYNIIGPGLLSANTEYVGYQGTAGAFAQSGGTNNITGSTGGLYIGQDFIGQSSG